MYVVDVAPSECLLYMLPLQLAKRPGHRLVGAVGLHRNGDPAGKNQFFKPSPLSGTAVMDLPVAEQLARSLPPAAPLSSPSTSAVSPPAPL